MPLLSRWATSRTFTTELGPRPWHPFVPMSGVSPQPGALNVPIKPTLQWNGADWATAYELQLADNPAFSAAIKKTISVTAWQSDFELKYATVYYWKVRATSATSQSEWSDVGTFTTVAEPAPPPVEKFCCPQDGLCFNTQAELQAHWKAVHAPVAPETPMYIWAIVAIGAILVVVVLVLIVRTRRPT